MGDIKALLEHELLVRSEMSQQPLSCCSAAQPSFSAILASLGSEQRSHPREIAEHVNHCTRHKSLLSTAGLPRSLRTASPRSVDPMIALPAATQLRTTLTEGDRISVRGDDNETYVLRVVELQPEVPSVECRSVRILPVFAS